MTRKEEIKSIAFKEYGHIIDTEEGSVASRAFIKGALWADKHQPNPWRDAKNDPPKDGEWCLFKFETFSWSHGLYEARQMPNMAMNDYIKSGEIIGWMPIPETPKGDEK